MTDFLVPMLMLAGVTALCVAMILAPSVTVPIVTAAGVAFLAGAYL